MFVYYINKKAIKQKQCLFKLMFWNKHITFLSDLQCSNKHLKDSIYFELLEMFLCFCFQSAMYIFIWSIKEYIWQVKIY